MTVCEKSSIYSTSLVSLQRALLVPIVDFSFNLPLKRNRVPQTAYDILLCFISLQSSSLLHLDITSTCRKKISFPSDSSNVFNETNFNIQRVRTTCQLDVIMNCFCGLTGYSWDSILSVTFVWLIIGFLN